MQIDAPAYLVQGFYFQERQALSIGMKPIEGAVVLVTEAVFRDMFAGVIWRDEVSGEWHGTLTDPAGESELTQIKLRESDFIFVKKYGHRQDIIAYEFVHENDLWNGVYNGKLVGVGYANCVLTPIPEGMFEPFGKRPLQSD